MSRKQTTVGNLTLVGFEDIFKASGGDQDGEYVVQIPIADLYPPEFHPFHVNDDEAIISLVETAYGSNIHIFGEHIPRSVRASESTAQGVSIFTYDPNGKVAAAYAALTREVLADVA